MVDGRRLSFKKRVVPIGWIRMSMVPGGRLVVPSLSINVLTVFGEWVAGPPSSFHTHDLSPFLIIYIVFDKRYHNRLVPNRLLFLSTLCFPRSVLI